MPFIEINPDTILMFMANKSDKDTFETTPEELIEFGRCVEKQRSIYRLEEFGNFDSLNCLLGMEGWAPMMFHITYQGKEDKWEWDKVEVNKKHRLWDYMFNRYVLDKENEYFEKAYEEYLNNKK